MERMNAVRDELDSQDRLLFRCIAAVNAVKEGFHTLAF